MWVFNVFLYLVFLFGSEDMLQYREMVQAGSPCYAYIASLGEPGIDAGEQPNCFYDPSNINPGK